jgi:hypothetical protein
MMNVDKVVREALAPEVALMLLDCARIRAELDLTEGELRKISDRHARAAARVDVMMRRAKLEAVISKLQSNDLVEKAMRLARKRWPQWE